MKKLFKITYFLFLSVVLFITACQNDLYDDIITQHDGVDKNRISLSQFKNETKVDELSPFLSVPLSSETSSGSKSTSQLSDFVIDTLAIQKHISQNNKTTYTFRVYPLTSVAQPNEIYNLVYRKVNPTCRKPNTKP
jgi:hypothetical protein